MKIDRTTIEKINEKYRKENSYGYGECVRDYEGEGRAWLGIDDFAYLCAIEELDIFIERLMRLREVVIAETGLMPDGEINLKEE